jgi:hypothetical protein
MELFLNLLWLVIALVAVGMFHRRAGGAQASAGQRRNGWVALGCALVLLFFVISMTDDLHQEVVLIEESALSKRHVSALDSIQAHTAAPTHAHHLFAAALPPMASSPAWTLVGAVIPWSPAAAIYRVYAEPGRGPPRFTLS